MTIVAAYFWVVYSQQKKILESQYVDNLNLNAAINLINKKNDVEIFMFDQEKQILYSLDVDQFIPTDIDLSNLEEAIHPDDLKRYRCDYDSVINGVIDECVSKLRIFNSKLNIYEYFTHVIRPIKKLDGKVTHYIYSRRNDTHVRRLVEEKEGIIETLNLALKTAKIYRWLYKYESKELFILDHEMNESIIDISEYSSVFHTQDEYLQFLYFVENKEEDTGGQFVLELKLPSSDIYKPYHIDGVVKSDDVAHVDYFLGIAKDVSEEIDYQNRLRDKLELIETINESTPIGISFYDSNGILVSSNKAASDILGIDRDKAFYQSTTLFQNRIPLESSLNTLNSGGALNFKFSYEELYRYIHTYIEPGKPHGDFFEIKCTPVIGQNSEIKGYVSICIDTTHFINDKRQIKALQDQITLALDASDVTIIAYSRLDNFFNVVYGSRKLFDNIYLEDIKEYVSFSDYVVLTSGINNIFDGAIDSVTFVIKVIKADEEYWLRIVLGVNHNDEARTSLIGTYKDITDEMRVQQELREAKDRAQESERLKIAFLSNITHEIRTPMNAIVGFSELLYSCDDPSEREVYYKVISKNNDILLSMIDSIIDMSRIESGNLELNLETFDFASAFYETYLMFKERFDKSGLDLILYDSCLECIVTLDRKMLFKIIHIYLNNALKFTKVGYVKMRYENKDNGMYVVIEDSGIGVAKDRQHLLFNRFDKIDHFVQGAGLGLSISKAIAESMGGGVGVESLEGKGSSFWVWIPCEVNCVCNSSESQNTSN